MVTANTTAREFISCSRRKTVMNDSSVEKYIRAKKQRGQMTPQNLYGSPSEEETNEFLAQQDAQQREKNQKTLEKYDLTSVPKDFYEKEIVTTTTTTVTSTSAAAIVSRIEPIKGTTVVTIAASISTTIPGPSYRANDSEIISTSSSSNAAVEGFVFQPQIVTEDNPLRDKNLFSPIEKIDFETASIGSSSSSTPSSPAEFCLTLKRRRDSTSNGSPISKRAEVKHDTSRSPSAEEEKK